MPVSEQREKELLDIIKTNAEYRKIATVCHKDEEALSKLKSF